MLSGFLTLYFVLAHVNVRSRSDHVAGEVEHHLGGFKRMSCILVTVVAQSKQRVRSKCQMRLEKRGLFDGANWLKANAQFYAYFSGRSDAKRAETREDAPGPEPS